MVLIYSLNKSREQNVNKLPTVNAITLKPYNTLETNSNNKTETKVRMILLHSYQFSSV